MKNLKTFIFLSITYLLNSSSLTAGAQNNTVIINGINRTGDQLLYLHVDRWAKSFIGTQDIILGKEKYTSDSTFSITIENVKKPMLCFIDGLKIYGSPSLFISPGDRITLVIEKQDEEINKLFFKGKNAAHYNYDIDLTAAIMKYNLRSAKNWSAYNATVGSIQLAANKVLNKYLSKPVSPLFKRIIKRENLVRHYALTGAVFAYKASFTDTLLPKHLVNIRDVPFNLLADTSLLYSRAYTLGLSCLLNSINGKPGFDRTAKNLQLSYTNICKYFKGKTREYLLADLLHYYGHNAQLTVDAGTYSRVWSNCFNKIKDTYYKQWMLDSKQFYFEANQPFPLNAGNSVLKDADGKPVTLKDILAENKNSPVVIDFWATWCGACKQEFREGDAAVNDLKKKGYKFIYVSLDKFSDSTQIKTDVKRFNLSANYILDNVSDSSLKKFLNINNIPRYVLLDKDGKIKNLDMPKPSNQLAFKSILARL